MREVIAGHANESQKLALPGPLAQTLAELREKLVQTLGEKLFLITLYGSYARGEATPDSDVDLMVVLRQPHPDDEQQVRRLVYEAMWQINFAYYLSLYLIDLTHYHRLEQQAASILENIKYEGQVLWQPS